MRALSLWRPWPALILWAGKPIENRGWTTSYRGPFALHAGQKWDSTALDFADRINWPSVDHRLDMPDGEEFHPTGVVALADLVDVCGRTVVTALDQPRTCDCGPWAVPGMHHWRLDNIRPLSEAIPCPGKQGWWAVPPAVLAAIDHHLQGVA